MAFHRWDKQGPADSVVVVVNMTNQNREGYHIGFIRAGLWKTRLNSDLYNYGLDFSNHSILTSKPMNDIPYMIEIILNYNIYGSSED